ncbi:MAG: hypothetical protein CMP11_09275 [Zetaproteobacteria bacterium]|nr:hypothetical protein [Pseudobdellovibrionaceae bacterium]|tara:strand:- start:676 stop:1545 length:870 start_codon:yes stop_codon:yes gene_type:complete
MRKKLRFNQKENRVQDQIGGIIYIGSKRSFRFYFSKISFLLLSCTGGVLLCCLIATSIWGGKATSLLVELEDRVFNLKKEVLDYKIKEKSLVNSESVENNNKLAKPSVPVSTSHSKQGISPNEPKTNIIQPKEKETKLTWDYVLSNLKSKYSQVATENFPLGLKGIKITNSKDLIHVHLELVNNSNLEDKILRGHLWLILGVKTESGEEVLISLPQKNGDIMTAEWNLDKSRSHKYKIRNFARITLNAKKQFAFSDKSSLNFAFIVESKNMEAKILHIEESYKISNLIN